MPRKPPRTRKGWIWPQDRRNPRKPFFLRALSDILTGRGADMYIGSLAGKGPSWAQWGRWPEYGNAPHVNDEVLEDWCTPWWAKTRKGQRYYPDTRRYERRFRPGPAPRPSWGPGEEDDLLGVPPFFTPRMRDGQDARWRRPWTSMPRSRWEACNSGWALDPRTGQPNDGWREGLEGYVGTPWDGPHIGFRGSEFVDPAETLISSWETDSGDTW